MAQGNIWKKLQTPAIVLTGVILSAGTLYNMNVFKGFGFAPQSIIVGGTGISAESVASGGACPDTGGTNVRFSANYIDVTNNNNATGIATAVGVYRSGTQNPLINGSTTAGGSFASIGTVNCGDTGLLAYIGDHGTTYYTAKVTFAAKNALNTDIPAVTLKHSSAATISFSNSTSFGQVSVAVVTASGTMTSDAKLKIKAGSYYYGDGAQEVCATYNQSNVSRVSFSYARTTLPEIVADPTISLSVNEQMKCYELTGDLNNAIAKELDVNIYPMSGVTPANSSVGVYINDKASWVKNGDLMLGYWNTDTNQDVGLAKVSKTGAIFVNP